MTQIDLIVFLIATLLGAYGASLDVGGRGYVVAWIILAVWSALKLAHVMP